MDEMPSAEFRKKYAKLDRPTLVTVNGHPIGKWQPLGYTDEVSATTTGEVTVIRTSPGRKGPPEPFALADGTTFNSRPFTPVPKTKGT